MSNGVCEPDTVSIPRIPAELPVASHDARREWFSVALMSSAAFIFVTAEILPVGLLPQISHSLNVSPGRVGFLLTLYAALAGLSAIPLTMRTSHVQRDRLLVVLMAIFTGSTLLSAIAPTYPLLAASRLICALAHGVFWATLTPTVVRIVGQERASRGTAMVYVGTSLAAVLGVPLSTILGVTLGWRVAMGVISAFGLIVVLLLRTLLPPLPANERQIGIRLSSLMSSPKLRAVAIVTAVIVGGQFTSYTYIAPLLKRQVGLGGVGLSALLLGFGIAGLVGNIVGSRPVDVRPGVVVGISFVFTALAYLLLVVSGGHLAVAVVAVILWGLAFSTFPLSVKSAVFRVSPHAPDLASAVSVVAFQIGIGGGALLGGAIVDAGDVLLLPWIGITTLLVGALVAFSVPEAFPRRWVTATA